MRRLIIRPGAIGDCILSFPALEYLVTAYTEVWVSSAVVPLIRFADTVRSISSCGLDLVGIPDVEIPASLRARLQSFDSIVSWYGSKLSEFRDAMLAMNPNCQFYPALPLDFALHATDFYAAQVGAPMGLIPRIRVDNLEARNVAVIHPFSGSRSKNWPLERFRELASQLTHEVEWLAGPEDDLPEARRFDDLLEVARFIAGARLYIGNDSGITHLAAALGVKTIAIFGPKSPKIWVPRGEHVELIAVRDLTDLKPSFVGQIASRLLDSHSS